MGGVLRVTEVPSAFTGITYAVGIVFDTAV
jgi:hypothetical protein